MYKVLILYRIDNWDKPSPIQDSKYRKVAEMMTAMAADRNVEMYHASIRWFKNDRFVKAWQFDEGKWKRVKNVKPDLIWLKMSITPKVNFLLEEINVKFPFLNPLPFEKLNDKALISRIFYKWVPKTVKILDYKEFKKSYDLLDAQKIVFKPLKGSGGKGVSVVPRKNSTSLRNAINRGVVQRFIDSSYGIKGIVRGYHDLRLVYLDNKLNHAYVRTPARGKLLANIAQGGKMTMIPVRKLPRQLTKMAKELVGIIAHYRARYYTLDFIFDKDQRPYLLEMNTMPGAYFNPEDRAFQIKFFNSLIEVFKSRIKQKRKEKLSKK